MFHNCSSFRDAISQTISDPAAWDEDGGCTVGHLHSLVDELNAGEAIDLYEEIVALVTERRAFTAVPLALLDYDTLLMPVTWKVGVSSPLDVEKEFGPAHKTSVGKAGRRYLYDLYVEDVEDGYPQPPQPYDVRDKEAEERPSGCNFPFRGVWPPEALQVEFVFDDAGILRSFDFGVGARVT